MRTYTAHVKDGRAPLLRREGWSWSAFVFGPLWLAAARAWIPAMLEVAALVVLFAAAPAPFWRPALLGLALLNGLAGRDMAGWSLTRRGYALAHVVLAADADAAMLRLFAARPELVDRAR